MSQIFDVSSEARFLSFVEELVGVIGHADRAGPLRDYCTGLLLPAERKSVEPMAAITAPSRVAAQAPVTASFRRAIALVGRNGHCQGCRDGHARGPGQIEAWIIDDTSFPKKGRHSVGVARQYSGQLGKQDNCQVAVSLSIANDAASLPVAYRLFLPQDWADDPARRQRVGVPEDVGFKTKPMIALDQIIAACDAGLPRGIVLMDAGYGADTKLRSGVITLGLTHAAGILPQTSLWTRDNPPPSPRVWSGRGRPPKLMRRDREHQPVSAKTLALGLPDEAWIEITWREGCEEPLASRFARVRVRPAHRDYNRSEPRPEEWLLIEWPTARTSRANTGCRPSQRASPSIGWCNSPRCGGGSSATISSSSRSLGSATTRAAAGGAFTTTQPSAAAYGFLIAERARFPPPLSTRPNQTPTPGVPGGRRSRSAATATRTARAELDRDPAKTPHKRTRAKSRAMSLLCNEISAKPNPARFMTQ